MKKILVPIDFSDYSEYALEVAATIARGQEAGIIVLHMIGLSEAVLAKDGSQEYAEARYYLRDTKERLDVFLDRDYLKGIDCSKAVRHLKVFNDLDQIAKEHRADLIVMGSHGTSGMMELFTGSNTEKVVRTSEVPVLVVKKRIPDFKISRIALAWHFKHLSSTVYRRADDFARSFGAELHLVYVNLPSVHFMGTVQIEQHITAFKERTGTDRDVTIFNAYSVEEGLLQFAHKIRADLLAVATHGRKGLVHFLVGSIGEAVANHADLPVLTFKQEAKGADRP